MKGSVRKKKIATQTLFYINQYRSSQGNGKLSQLPGLTKYAQYRSKQIITNFAHDTKDQRIAATTLKYGQYIDPSDFGDTGEPYYEVNAREAIGQYLSAGAIDEIAKSLADGVRNSSGHWAYVGSSQYSYVGLGVSYGNGGWYCSISVARTNIDQNPAGY